MRKKGFTLIELIVVMTILAILILFGMPKYKEYTKQAELTRLVVETKELEKASQQYYIRNNDWPRLNDDAYTSSEITAFGEKIYDSTGAVIVLEETGSYYDIGYNKLNKYISKPSKPENYILQNPVGSVYAIKGITEEAKKRVSISIPSIPSLPQPLQTTVPSGWIGIYTIEDLNNMRNNLSGRYILMTNLDFLDNKDYSDISNKEIWSKGLGWSPIGVYNDTDKFVGEFDGNGLIINNLYINTSGRYTGLFGATGTAIIKNLTIKNAYVSSTDNYSADGVLIGYAIGTNISNVKVEGEVKGNTNGQTEGGLVGLLNTGTITQCISGVNITGISNSAGSLVGYLNTVTKVTDSYAYGDVSGITNCGGGFVGRMLNSSVYNSYSTGKVTGTGTNKGGFTGYLNAGVVSNCYWDIESSNITSSLRGVGKTTIQMKQQATYVGWNFTNVWSIDENNDYPRLRLESK